MSRPVWLKFGEGARLSVQDKNFKLGFVGSRAQLSFRNARGHVLSSGQVSTSVAVSLHCSNGVPAAPPCLRGHGYVVFQCLGKAVGLDIPCSPQLSLFCVGKKRKKKKSPLQESNSRKCSQEKIPSQGSKPQMKWAGDDWRAQSRRGWSSDPAGWTDTQPCLCHGTDLSSCPVSLCECLVQLFHCSLPSTLPDVFQKSQAPTSSARWDLSREGRCFCL